MSRPRILEELHLDHQRLARILTALETWSEEDAEYDAATIDRVGAMIEYLSEYPETMHHPLEDRVFDLLLLRSLSTDDRNAVVENAKQHRKLRDLTKALAAELDTTLRGDRFSPEKLRQKAKEYARIQFDHMGFEENVVFLLAEREFTSEDWTSIESAERLSHDPLFDQRLSRFQSLYDFVNADDKPLSSSLRQPAFAGLPDMADSPYLGARAFAEFAGAWSAFFERLQQLQAQQGAAWQNDLEKAQKTFASNDPFSAYSELCAQQTARQLDVGRAVFDAWSAAIDRHNVIARRFLTVAPPGR